MTTPKRPEPARHAGFTLIELVITIAIVGVLAMMSVPLLEVLQQRQKEAQLREALRQIRTAIDAYHQAGLDKRIEIAADASGYPPNLDVLVNGVIDITSPEGRKLYFLRRLPADPFAGQPVGNPAASWGKRSYQSPPDAPREGDDVFDVYSLSDRTGLNGLAYRLW